MHLSISDALVDDALVMHLISDALEDWCTWRLVMHLSISDALVD